MGYSLGNSRGVIPTNPKNRRPNMNRFCSMFSQILQLFPRSDFELLVKETKAERHARGFTCWDQFVSMMFCQLGRAYSLREICNGLLTCAGKKLHLGSLKLPSVLLWPMPTNIVPGNSTRDFSFCCWSAVAKTLPLKRSSDLRTSWSAWTPP